MNENIVKKITIFFFLFFAVLYQTQLCSQEITHYNYVKNNDECQEFDESVKSIDKKKEKKTTKKKDIHQRKKNKQGLSRKQKFMLALIATTITVTTTVYIIKKYQEYNHERTQLKIQQEELLQQQQQLIHRINNLEQQETRLLSLQESIDRLSQSSAIHQEQLERLPSLTQELQLIQNNYEAMGQAAEQLAEQVRLLETNTQEYRAVCRDQYESSQQRYTATQTALAAQRSQYEEQLNQCRENYQHQATQLTTYLRQQQEALRQATTIPEPPSFGSFLLESLSWGSISQAARTAADLSQAAHGISRAAGNVQTLFAPTPTTQEALTSNLIHQEAVYNFPTPPRELPELSS